MKKPLIYLDNASTTFPKPEIVHDTVRDFYSRNGVNPGRSTSEMARNAEKMINGTRKKLSRFFNASLPDKDPNRLVFTLNATMSLNLIINGTVGPGDHVVTTVLEHNSVIRPVNHKVREGAEVTYVKPDGRGRVDPDDIRKAIRSNTSLVIIDHASNVIGTIQDIEAIGAVCREAEVPLALDTAQSAGVIPIDMARMNISFLAFTGHKALYGPSGTGGICVADNAEIKGTIYGGTGIASADPYHLESFPYCLEAGTLNLAGIAGLSAGIDWVMDKGIDSIYDHEMRLLEKMINGFSSIEGVRIWGIRDTRDRVATLSITLDNMDAEEVGRQLDTQYNIQTRAGLHCAPLIHAFQGTAPKGTVRFSIGPFNTEDEINTTVQAVAELARIK